MFEFLKKKISSWIGNGKEKPKKQKEKDVKKSREKKKGIAKKIKADKPEKKTSKIKVAEDNNQESRLLTKDEKETKGEVSVLLDEAERIPEDKANAQKEEKSNFFTKLFKKITSSKLLQKDFDDIFQEFEIILLENNVALEAVDKIKDNLSINLVGQQVKKTEAQARIMQALKDSILSVLIEPQDFIKQIKNHEGTFTIVFFGINGTGKTTSIAKIAYLLKKNGISCVLAAGDTFRAASIEQLKIHADRLKVPIVSSSYNADPASVAFEAKKYASAHKIKVILIDTAGRMYTKANLLKEMEKIIRVSQPNLKIFVGESITGNDAIDQAKTFNDVIGIDGIILSKADIDEKAGAILSVSYVTKKPIYFLGTGQNYEDLLPFTKKTVLKNIGLE